MNRITEVTRRDIFELLVHGEYKEDFLGVAEHHYYNFWGRLTTVDFLNRLYNLKELPSYDSRCSNAEGDIAMHTIANPDDYPEDWLFTDDRFPLKNGADEDLLKFICEIFHPVVREESADWSYFKSKIDDLLQKDRYRLHVKSELSGRSVFGWQDMTKPRFIHISDEEFNVLTKFFVHAGYVLDIATRREFSEFTLKTVNVDVLARYNYSMGQSLLCYCEDCSESEFINISNALMERYEKSKQKELDSECDKEQMYIRCKGILGKLKRGNLAIEKSVQAIKERFSSKYIQSQIDVMLSSQKENPTDAIGKAKELVESCCRTILEAKGVVYNTDDNVSQLVKATTKQLRVTPDDIPDTVPQAQSIKAILGNMAGIAHHMAELRNAYGSGHGKSDSYRGLQERHAKLAVGASSTLVHFLWDSYERDGQK